MIDRLVNIVREGGKVLHASESAMLCAISHGQLIIDGYVVQMADIDRWRRSQLQGRTISIHHRKAVIFSG